MGRVAPQPSSVRKPDGKGSGLETHEFADAHDPIPHARSVSRTVGTKELSSPQIRDTLESLLKVRDLSPDVESASGHTTDEEFLRVNT